MAGIVLGRYLPFSFLPFYIFSLILFAVTFSLFLKEKTSLVSLFLFSLILLTGYLYFSLTYFPSSSNHIVNFAPSEVEVEIVGRVVSRPSEKIFSKRKRVSFILKAEIVEPVRSNQEHSSQISSSESEEAGISNTPEESAAANESPLETRLAEVERDHGKLSPDVPREKNTLYGETEGKVWVNSYSPYWNFGYGDRVRVRGKLRLPQPAREKGDFDWQRYLSYQGVWVELHTGWVEMLESSDFSLVRWAQQNEDHLAARIEKTLPDPHAQITKSILLGDKERLPPPILEDFRRTGTAHVLVVSGLHVGLILFIFFFVLRTLGLSAKIISVFSLPILLYYALLTGLRAPVVRASFMATVGITCLLIDRDTPLMVILSLAAFFILILNPLSLFTVSFQLSFVAVGGIIYLTSPLEKKLHFLPRYLAKSLAVSLAAQLSVLPLLAFYFHQLPLIGVVVNLILAPLITVILALGFLSLSLGLLFLPAAQLIANTNWLIIKSLLWVVEYFSFSSNSILSRIACPSIGPFPASYLIGYYLGLVFISQLPRILSYIRRKARIIDSFKGA